MSHVQTALTYFKEGCSCSQAIFAAYGPQLGVDRENALRIASTFSGGMGLTGETCGAVTGALMVLGLKYDIADADAKAKSIQRAKEFLNKFKACYGSNICRDLMGYDLNTPSGLAFIKDNKLNETLCPKYVQAAAEILEQML